MKILIIRRDNIGDLVCTTPLFSALRQCLPTTRIFALVNSYNAPALAGNPDIDEVCVYRKAKHRNAGESRFNVWLQTASLIRDLRRERFDVAIVATPGKQPSALKFARWVKPGRIVAYGDASMGISDPLPLALANDGHESEAVMRLLAPLGITAQPGPLSVFASQELAAAIRVPAGQGPLVALHLSARKPAQRWPIERFAELARALHARESARFLVFWSPGPDNHPQHPGDDEKATRLLALCDDLPMLPCATHRLEELVAGLSRCALVVCSDGGAMHIAAGLGKPILCFFGNSDLNRWHPWGVPYQALQKPSLDVQDISVDEALAAYERLRNICA